jgi:protein gp37
MQHSWALDIRYECGAAGVPFFMKQGSQANWKHWRESEIDKWPEPLQCREYPI